MAYFSSNAKGSLSSTTHSNGTSFSYFYDNYSRIIQKTEHADQDFNYFYTYDSKGNLLNYQFPSGFSISHTYENGYMKRITNNGDGSSIFAPKDYTAKGQLRWWDNGAGDIIHTFNEYDQYGFPTNVLCGVNMGNWGIQNLETHFNTQTGNLEYRTDKNFMVNGSYLTENFTYDNVHKNRLASWQPSGQQSPYTMTYGDNNGNILTKNDVTSAGNPYIYETNKPHAAHSITSPLQLPAEALQNITYNRFNKVEAIQHNNQGLRLNITYGPDEQRIKSEFYTNNVLNKTKYFIGGDYEVEKLPNGTERRIHYLPGGGIYVSNELGTGQMYYAQTDYQGSWSSITNATGNIVERYSFDPWGRRRNPTDWSFNNVSNTFTFDRGYTGHEMLDAFGLINMNGRVYDPVIARFLSPDNYVQAPNNSQGFNRYSYCLNNPLVYTDPDGNNPLILAAIIIGALSGGYTGYKIAEAHGYNLGNLQTYGFMLGGAAIGGLSGYLGASIAAGGGFMANTAGLMASSITYSMGMTPLSGGMMEPSVNFGAASFNLGNGKFNSLFNRGNKWYEELGYSFGALANVQDAFAGVNGTTVDVKSRPKLTGHSEIDGKYYGKDITISVGPDDILDENLNGLKWEMQYVKLTLKGESINGANGALIESNSPQIITKLNNVNGRLLSSMTDRLNSGRNLLNTGPLKYGLFNGCVNYTSRALFYSGVFNINALLPVTSPVLLNFELTLRNIGIIASPFLTNQYQK
jgi:RHS repeat-associated protein